MNFEIKHNDKPDLPLCQFSVDDPLHKRLSKYELTKYLNTHTCNAFVGAPGSGKTSLIYAFFKSKHLFKKVFDKIYLFQPLQSRASMKDQLFDQLPEDQKFSELTFDNLSEVLERIKDEPHYIDDDDKKHICNYAIILDDVGSFLKDYEVEKLLKQICQNRRHLHVSLFFIVQTIISLPKDVRKLIKNWFIFKVSKETFEQFMEESIEKITNKKDIKKLNELVYDAKYNFLFVNTDRNAFFKNFDEILINE